MSRLSRSEIQLFIHCARCSKQIPRGVRPRDWQRIEVGWTDLGIQVWCKRHDCNITHIDFGGQKVAIDGIVRDPSGCAECEAEASLT